MYHFLCKGPIHDLEEHLSAKFFNKKETPKKLRTEVQIKSRKQGLNAPKTYAQIAVRNRKTNDVSQQREECKNHTNEVGRNCILKKLVFSTNTKIQKSGEQGDEPKRSTKPSSDLGQEELAEGIVQGHQLSENLILENMSCETLKKDWQRPRRKKRPAIYGTVAFTKA
ncbi:hypothetical protein HHI36_005881 [Cryptolaemus montrouzieri]|uniref:Uncharacterized protein n=1 Tax=Cryptolaemus montrouzieri TaxID=559131 RepID=A0ABD2NVL2_9CUCU